MDSRGRHGIGAVLLIGAALSLVATPVWSHKVNIFAYVEADSVRTESYFADGRKCVNVAVSLLDASGETLAAQQTNEEGMASLPVPALPPQERSDLRVVLQASMGHRAEYVLSAGELWPGTISGRTADAQAAEDANRPTAVAGAALLTQETMAQQLAPLVQAVRDLRREQERASVRDVIGGIGYILGLLGIYCYLRGRSR